MQKKDKSKGKRTSKMISSGRGQEGGIGGLLVLGGALALAGVMAMFTVKKIRTTRVNKNLTLPSDVSQQPNNDLCSKNNQVATRELPYLLEFPSRTMVENSWDRGQETSTVDNTNINSCELVSEKSVIVAETPTSRTKTDEGKGTLKMISSDDLKQNIVAGVNHFGFLPGLSGKNDPLEYLLPMKVTDEAKEDNDESCLNAPTDAVTDKQDDEEEQESFRENSDDGSEDTEYPCSELMAEAIWPDELIETMSKLEADKQKRHSEDNNAVENEEEVQLKRSIHSDSSSDRCDENETKQRSKVTWKKETYLALRMIEETLFSSRLQIRAWMVWSMLMFVVLLLLSLSLSSRKAMSFILSMFSEIQSTL